MAGFAVRLAHNPSYQLLTGDQRESAKVASRCDMCAWQHHWGTQLRSGNLKLKPGFKAEVSGVAIFLTPAEWMTLVTLIVAGQKSLGNAAEFDTGSSSGSLAVIVSRLRSKLSAAQCDGKIITVRRVGYRWQQPPDTIYSLQAS